MRVLRQVAFECVRKSTMYTSLHMCLVGAHLGTSFLFRMRLGEDGHASAEELRHSAAGHISPRKLRELPTCILSTMDSCKLRTLLSCCDGAQL